MFSRLRFALLAPLAALLACSGSSSSNNIAAPATANTGDYVITVAGGTAQASIFTGSITVSGTGATGIFRYNNPGTLCVPGNQDIPFIGTFANGSLTLTSSSFASSIATITLPLPFGANSSSQQVSTGTAVITGGTCVLASTTAKGQYIPGLTGNYSGALTGPVAGTASVVLAESPANADGQFPTTVGISFTSVINSNCNFSIPVSAPINGLISGATLQASNAANPNLSLIANAGSPPILISVAYTATGTNASACSGTYTGNVN
jgi:hypothetical protein